MHHRDLEERLKHAWPFYHEKPLWVRDWTALAEVWQRRRPGIVYYYGPAESDGTTLTLLLDGVQGDIDRRPIATLSQAWGAQPPQLLFCNFVGASVSPGTALSSLQLPLMISQNGVFPRRRASVLDTRCWKVMKIPIRCGPYTSTACQCGRLGAYSTWHTRTANEPPWRRCRACCWTAKRNGP